MHINLLHTYCILTAYYLKELDRAECKDNYTAAAVAEKFLNADEQFDDMDSEKLVAGPVSSYCDW